MPLEPGSKLGHYEIVSSLGAGGMGEVYRARDSKLGREVAIKVLRDEVASDPERLARFEREARVLASLNHPCIATLHGFEQEGDTSFLIMELVEGETLADRISHRRVPVDEAISIFIQIAEGLEAAHRAGVVHRDLKPANVKLSPEGRVKILDFGLARALEPEAASADPSTSQSPTLTLAATQRGEILGTAAYMSPEQAAGKSVDEQTDVWSFGVCLYETLTRRRPFPGATAPETLAKVLEREPDWEAVAEEAPAEVRRLLRRCLRKDRRQRLRHIGDAGLELAEALDACDPGRSSGEEDSGSAARPLRRALPWALTAAALAIAAATLFPAWPGRDRARPTGPMRLSVSSSPRHPLVIDSLRSIVALSPDRRRLVYVAENEGAWQLFLRDLDAREAEPIPGTEGGYGPFFSPDGEWVGFFSDWTMKKVALDGGAPVDLAVVPPVTRGATWSDDGSIYFTSNPNGGVSRVDARSAEAKMQLPTEAEGWNDLTTPDAARGELSHRWPDALPGGKGILITVDTGKDLGSSHVAVVDTNSGQVRTLLDGAGQARYADPGHLIFVRGRTLMGVRFDVSRLEIEGTPVPLVEDVALEPEGAAHFAVAGNVLVFVAGGSWEVTRRLVWVDRGGGATPLPLAPDGFLQPSLSPDGSRLAVTIAEGTNYDVWLYDLDRGARLRLTTHPGEDFNSVWTTDGQRIALSSEMTDIGPRLAWVAADGSGAPEVIGEKPLRYQVQIPGSFHPERGALAYTIRDMDTPGGEDVMLLSLDPETEPEPLLDTDFREHSPRFSPDGRWLAYVSDESGREEVYARAFPGPGRKYSLSSGGGREPVWSPQGDEIFYRTGAKLMAVAVNASGDEPFGPPEAILEGDFVQTHRPDMGASYDVGPTAKRFLMLEDDRSSAPTRIGVLLDWPPALLDGR